MPRAAADAFSGARLPWGQASPGMAAAGGGENAAGMVARERSSQHGKLDAQVLQVLLDLYWDIASGDQLHVVLQASTVAATACMLVHAASTQTCDAAGPHSLSEGAVLAIWLSVLQPRIQPWLTQ